MPAKAGIQNYLKTLDSRLRGNDAKRRFKTFYETINIGRSMFDVHLLKNPVRHNCNLRMPTKQVSANGASPQPVESLPSRALESNGKVVRLECWNNGIMVWDNEMVGLENQNE